MFWGGGVPVEERCQRGTASSGTFAASSGDMPNYRWNAIDLEYNIVFLVYMIDGVGMLN